MSSGMNGTVLPDRPTLDRFVGALFRHADDGTWINLRAYEDGKQGAKAIIISPARIGDARLGEWVWNRAQQAARDQRRAVFCPPVCTFATQDTADEANVANGVALSVECDAAPGASRRALTVLLGEPTIVSASGGEWTDPETGEVEPKLHLHWRLTEPTRDAEAHGQLKEARRLACYLVKADTTAVPVCHPLRWPGSVHRKGAPKLARIVSESDTEVELADVLDKLRAACPDAPKARATSKAAGAGLGFEPDLSGDLLDIVGALAVIPNVDLEWNEWNRIAMATWAASDGRGFAAFDMWSQRSAKYDAADTADRWDHIGKYPPSDIGAGTLYHLAREAVPGWRKPSSDARDAGRRDNPEAEPTGTKKAKASRSAKAPPRRENDIRPTIQIVAAELEETVDAAESALIKSGRGIYQRAGMIVGVGSAPVITADGKKITSPQIIELGEHRLLELVMSAAAFEKYDARSEGFVPCNAPMTVVKALQQRTGHLRLEPLAGVVNAPTMRSDGSLLAQEGYDPRTGLLFDPQGVEFPNIPDQPSRAQAQEALGSLSDVIGTFPFVSEADRSVALSGMLTACVRQSLRTAPMHAFTAPVAGSGKSKLVDVANVIATGREAGVIAMGKSEEELEKRLTALLLSGSAVAIDNIEAGLGGDCLCQLLSQPTMRGRVLGASRTPEMPTNVFVTATGNNVVLMGDMTRRALLCNLDPKVERPELREFEWEPVERAKAIRGELVSAALTVLRAYHVAGRPYQVTRLGSFEEWSDLVRSALMWLDQPDPVLTMERTRAYDPKTENLRSVMVQWRKVIGSERITASGAAQRAAEKTNNQYDLGKSTFIHPDFRDALLAVAGSGGFIEPAKLGTWLGRNKGRVIEDMCFEPDPQVKGISAWRLCIGQVAAHHGTRF